MAQESQAAAAVCAGNWYWNSPRNLFNSSSHPCSSNSYDLRTTLGWLTDELLTDAKTPTAARSLSGDDSAASDSSVVIQHPPPPPPPLPTGSGHVSVSAAASTLEIMGTPIDDDVWNQDFLNNHNQRSDEDYPQMNINYYVNNDFRQMNQSTFPPSAPISDSSFTPLNSSLYNSSFSHSILQTLFDEDFDQQPLQSLPENRTNYPNYPNQLSDQNVPRLTQTHPMVKPNSFPQKPPGGNNHSHFSNNTPFWNSTASAVVPSLQPQFRPPSFATTKPNPVQSSTKRHHKQATDSAMSKKSTNESPAAKRARGETPLPAFKVRKEKLGDRITALQQLVSPFGKTDTASVLQEAIEYIQFLHDQVNGLSAPYLKNGSPPLQHQQVGDQKGIDKKGITKDLRSRGLCLVPVPSIFPVASETTSDFWTPTFGGGFR